MAVEIVTEHAAELIAGGNVGTSVDHVTTRQRLVESGVVTTIQFVDDHLPNGMTTASAVLRVSTALVWHTEVESVGPNGNAAERGSNGRIIDEELISHHVELFVATDAKVGGADTDDGSVRDISKALNDQTVTSHLGQPVIVGALRPVLGVVLVGDGEGGNLVTSSVEILNSRIVGVLVGYEESSCSTKKKIKSELIHS